MSLICKEKNNLAVHCWLQQDLNEVHFAMPITKLVSLKALPTRRDHKKWRKSIDSCKEKGQPRFDENP